MYLCCIKLKTDYKIIIMYKTISNEIIRSINSKSNLLNIITDENEKLPIKDWVQKYINIVPTNDIIWLLVREEFLSAKDLILFAVWCAREALKLVEIPDERSVNACNVTERYANGQATKEELLAARAAAYDAIDAAYITAANYVTKSAYSASYFASEAAYASYTAHSISYSARIAAHYASDAATNAALAYVNAVIAAYAVSAEVDVSVNNAYIVYANFHTSQINKLLTYFD
jgi:hypothetical protein